MAAPETQLVVIPFHKLEDSNADLSSEIKQGFGPNGLGVLAVSGIPRYTELRQRLLPLAQQFAALPEEVKAQYEHCGSSYNVGWSHGKESLKPGVLDTAKGSFYANPMQDTYAVDNAAVQQYPSYYSSNLWPAAELPQLEPAFKELGQLIIQVGIKLMQHCVRYLQNEQQQQGPAGVDGSSPPRSPSSSSPNLAQMLQASQCHKARLLHYFPPNSSLAADDMGDDTGDGLDQRGDSAGWCGWHLDHSALTGLTSAQYLDNEGHQVPVPDPSAGLFIRNRAGQLVQVSIPPDCCGFQLGQVAAIASGGLLRATPHCVRAPAASRCQGVSRNTFAVFMQPDVLQPLSAPRALSSPLRAWLEQDSGEWRAGMRFGEFAEKTMSRYYGQAQALQQQRQVLVTHE